MVASFAMVVKTKRRSGSKKKRPSPVGAPVAVRKRWTAPLAAPAAAALSPNQ
jgi:hypothetical protein